MRYSAQWPIAACNAAACHTHTSYKPTETYNDPTMHIIVGKSLEWKETYSTSRPCSMELYGGIPLSTIPVSAFLLFGPDFPTSFSSSSCPVWLSPCSRVTMRFGHHPTTFSEC